MPSDLPFNVPANVPANVKSLPRWQLRARFAAAMSEMYGREVSAYRTLVETSREVNRDVLAGVADGSVVGETERVSAERHGAIRVGSPREMHQVSRIFAVLGMYPVGFYDLREAARKSVPVVATAFRPIEAAELARNPFRVFTSMLVTDDPRFFDADIQRELEAFLAARTLFPDELMALVERAETNGGLTAEESDTFLDLALQSFALSKTPIRRAWYERLREISAVAADIGAEAGTHINHLTPRVLDIDALYRRMEAQGIEMIDQIQGPPSWDGPFVLLRQTSFRALDEEREMLDEEGRPCRGTLRVRFGEVEARGAALTPEGRALYDRLLAAVDADLAADPSRTYQDAAKERFEAEFPASFHDLARQGLGYFVYRPTELGLRLGPVASEPDVLALLEAGHLSAEPIVYEDFLPKSAAGIFQSNLTGDGRRREAESGRHLDAGSLSAILGRRLLDPYALYEAQQNASIEEALAAIGYARPGRLRTAC